MRSSHFYLGILSLVCASFLFVFHVPFVKAENGCVGGPAGVSGTCQASCNGTSEILIDQLIPYGVTLSKTGCPDAKTAFCCVTMGDSLCTAAGAKFKNETAKAIPGKDEASDQAAQANVSLTWSCQNPCTGKPLPGAGAVCGKKGICCGVPGPAGSTATAGKSPTADSPTTLSNPLGPGATLFTIINRITTMFLGLVGAAAFFVFIIAGITWMTAGSSKRVESAQKMIQWAVIGLAAIIFSYAITKFFLDSLTTPIEVGAPVVEQPAVPQDLVP